MPFLHRTTTIDVIAARRSAALSLVSSPSLSIKQRILFLKLIIISSAGILETIFDGIQRPLETIARISGSVFVPRGVELPNLD